MWPCCLAAGLTGWCRVLPWQSEQGLQISGICFWFWWKLFLTSLWARARLFQMLWRVNSPPVTPDSSNSTSFLFKTKPQSYEKSFAQWCFWLSGLCAYFVCLGKHVGFDMWSHGLKIITNHYFKSSLSESLVSRKVLVCYSKPPLAKIPVSEPRGAQAEAKLSLSLPRVEQPGLCHSKMPHSHPPVQGTGEHPYPDDLDDSFFFLKNVWNKHKSTQKNFIVSL